jgi:hypothetical protein
LKEGNNNGAKNVPNRFGLMASNKIVFHLAEKQKTLQSVINDDFKEIL